MNTVHNTAAIPLAAGSRLVWRELTRLAPGHGTHWGAMQVAVSVAIPLGTLAVASRVDLMPYAAFGALASVYGKRTPRASRARAQAVTGLALIVAVVLGVVSSASTHLPVAMLSVAMASVIGLALTWFVGWLPVPSLFLVFAVGSVAATPHRWSDLGLAAVTAAAAVVMAMLVSQVFASFDSPDGPVTAVDGRAAVSYGGLGGLTALYFLAPLAAAGVALALGIGHPFWAAVSAVVPLSGHSFSNRIGRAVNRFAGTLMGVLLAWLIFSLGLPMWALVAVIAVLQLLTELFVARHYGIAVIWITPMALLLSSLGTPVATDQLITDRIVGALVGIAVSAALLTAYRSLLRRVRRRRRARARREGADHSPRSGSGVGVSDR